MQRLDLSRDDLVAEWNEKFSGSIVARISTSLTGLSRWKRISQLASYPLRASSASCWWRLSKAPKRVQAMSFDYLALREIFFEKLGIVTAYTQRLVKSFRVSWRNHFWLYAPRQATLSQSAPDIAHAPPKVDLSPFFSDYDRQLTSSLAVIMIQTAADPARHDAEGEAVCRDKRFRRSNSNFLHKGMCATILTTPTTKN